MLPDPNSAAGISQAACEIGALGALTTPVECCKSPGDLQRPGRRLRGGWMQREDFLELLTRVGPEHPVPCCWHSLLHGPRWGSCPKSVGLNPP